MEIQFQPLIFYGCTFLLCYLLTLTLLQKHHNLPPSPFPSLPFLGHLYLLRNPNLVHKTLSKISAQYGPIVSLHLGFRPALLISSPSAAEECLSKNDVIFANRPRLVGAKILGYDYTNILWAPYGPLWRNHRRIAATQILSAHRLQLLSNIRADEVKWLIGRLIKLSDEDRTVEIKQLVSVLTNNVMMRMIAGKRFFGSETEAGAERFREMMAELMGLGGAANGGDYFPLLRRLGMFKGGEEKIKRVFVKMDGILQELVDEKRKEMEDKGIREEKSKTLIEVLLDIQKTDPSYSDDNILKGLVQILLLAGSETSTSTIEWAVSLLLNHPQVLNKAQKEIDDQVGHTRLLEESDLTHLPYLHSIINETLRMYPATPLLPPHESSADCTVGGYNVPKGTMLMVNIWGIHNDSNNWDEPEKFKPERFENLQGGHRVVGYKFMPFGSGRRACPGENLAMRVVGLTLGSLLQCFHWERVDEEMVDMEEKFSVSMWKAKPLQAKCRPRQGIAALI